MQLTNRFLVLKNGGKIMKKITSLIFALVLVFNIFSVTSFAQEKLNYLVLGDSIAYADGIVNAKQACYGKIVADTNDYDYKNLAVNGYTSSDLLSYLSVDYVAEAVTQADIIQISIGGNDFLRSNLPGLLLGGIFGNMTMFDEVQKDFENNFIQIIQKIKELNPDATILMQTLYNPLKLLMSIVYQHGVDRVNGTIKAYLEENPEAFTIVDVENRFKGQWGYIAVDMVHPNSKGNLEIAKLTLEVLVELGLGNTTTPKVTQEGIDWVGLNSLNIFNYLTALFLRFV